MKTIAAGTTGIVRCYKQILNTVSIKNDVGGTGELPIGNYRVQITKTWHDYETGQRCIATLLDPKDIEVSRKAGTTGYTADHYLKYKDKNPSLYADAVKAAKEYDPSTVYFFADDFTPD